MLEKESSTWQRSNLSLPEQPADAEYIFANEFLMGSPNFELIRIEGQAYRRGAHPSAYGVLLTATISPPQGSVARADPAARLRDYQEALAFYLTLPPELVDRILFIDNSASDLEPFVRLARSISHHKAVELIGFAGNDHPASFGKVYGEFKLMDFGLARCSLFSESDRFWKVTGRLRLLNIVEMIRAVPPNCDLLCDLHNVPLVGTGKLWNNNYMELRTFCCTRGAYDRLFTGRFEALGAEMSAGYLYDLVVQSRGSGHIVPRFPVQPRLAGYSGRHNRAYDSGGQALKTRVRSILRRAAPWLWI